MEWIDGFERTAEGLKPIFVSSLGRRYVGQLKDIRQGMDVSASLWTPTLGVDLGLAKVASSTEYLLAIGFRAVTEGNHSVYEFARDGRRLLVPASVLLTCLVGNLKHLGDHLLRPASLDILGVARADGNKLTIEFARNRGLPYRTAGSKSTIERFSWLLRYPSARRMWASVYTHAEAGRMELALPAARVQASFKVLTVGDLDIATAMVISGLDPTENPVDAVAGYVPRQYVFREFAVHGRNAGELVKVNESPVVGARLTNKEWSTLAPLLWKAVRSRSSPRETLDAALVAFSGARCWQDLGPAGHAARCLYLSARRRGTWDLFVEALIALREGRFCPLIDETVPRKLTQSERRAKVAKLAKIEAASKAEFEARRAGAKGPTRWHFAHGRGFVLAE